jgi:hypothetical protein
MVMKITVCPKCGHSQTNAKLLGCPDCNELYVERDTDEPLRLSEEHLDEIAKRIAKTFKQDEDLERIATKVVHSFRKDEWKPLAEQVIRLLHLHDIEQIAKTILGMRQFWVGFVVILAVALLLIYEIIGHKVESIAEPMFRIELTNQIRLQFQEPRISNIVVSVARNEATNIIVKEVDPALFFFNSVIYSNAQAVATVLSNYGNTLRVAQTNTAELKRLADFYLLAMRAQGLRKSAFWEFDAIAEDASNPMQLVARALVAEIVEQVHIKRNIYHSSASVIHPWEGTTSTSETATYEAYISKMSEATTPVKCILMIQLCAQTRFPLRARLAFLADMIERDEDLQIVDEACFLMGQEAHLNLNFMATRQYLAWYRDWLKTNEVPASPKPTPH